MLQTGKKTQKQLKNTNKKMAHFGSPKDQRFQICQTKCLGGVDMESKCFKHIADFPLYVLPWIAGETTESILVHDWGKNGWEIPSPAHGTAAVAWGRRESQGGVSSHCVSEKNHVRKRVRNWWCLEMCVVSNENKFGARTQRCLIDQLNLTFKLRRTKLWRTLWMYDAEHIF